MTKFIKSGHIKLLGEKLFSLRFQVGRAVQNSSTIHCVLEQFPHTFLLAWSVFKLLQTLIWCWGLNQVYCGTSCLTMFAQLGAKLGPWKVGLWRSCYIVATQSFISVIYVPPSNLFLDHFSNFLSYTCDVCDWHTENTFTFSRPSQ